MNNIIASSFLSLVRLGIGNQTNFYGTATNWNTIKALADKQGLSAVIFDSFEKLSEGKRPPKDILLPWIGEVLQNYEGRYVRYENAISSLAGFYKEHDVKMMLLKGYTLSLDWPRPNHRPCGDIDIWQFGKQKEADVLLAQEKGVKIDNSHHHHTVFQWKGFTVENHYDFVNVHAHEISREQEKVFKELGKDESCSITLDGVRVYSPTPNLHALFIIRHLANHFSAAEITLRQLLDWGFFAQKHKTEIDWVWLENMLVQFDLKILYDIFNAICVADLGFAGSVFPKVQFEPELKDRVLKDILSPEVPNERPLRLMKRISWKWKRWNANKWKHDLVYKESRWSAFWRGLRSHLQKPASI